MVSQSFPLPRIFISYSHDTPQHMERVLGFARHLRDLGFSCPLDQDVASPAEGWPRWTQHRIEEADYVLVACTETYRRRFEGREEDGGKGVNWEAVIITNFLYDSRVATIKFIPVVFSPEDVVHIPIALRGPTFYNLTQPSDYESLIRRLSQHPVIEPVVPPAPAYQPPAYQPPVAAPPTYQPPVAAPPAYQPPAPQPPAYQPPAYQPPANTPSAYNTPPVAPPSPTYQPPVVAPQVYQPPVATPPVYQQPAYQQPAPQPPAYQPPAYQQPVVTPPVAPPAPIPSPSGENIIVEAAAGEVTPLVKHNLPQPSTAYVGRAAEIASWRELLLKPDTRLVTLTGFGGMGKTRSALQLSHLCLEDFADGCWWVELDKARTQDDMWQHVAYALNLYVQPPLTAKDYILNFLRGRRLLLALDNTEQIAEASIVVKEMLLAIPEVKFLITSRRALQLQGERRIEVLPLPPSDAKHLFAERARSCQADFELTAANTNDVAEICRRLEGVPLAIELAASRITGLEPRAILQRLNERFRLLQTRAPDLPPRQRALRGAIDWSYDLLTDDDKSLFVELSVFAGGFSLEDVEAVCTVPDPFEGLMELRQHSMLNNETDSITRQQRYTMLESLHEYAAEKLAASPQQQTQVRQRHAEYFLNFAREAIDNLHTPREAQALRGLEVNFENARRAMDWCLEAGRTEWYAALALALGQFLARIGFLSEALERVKLGLDAMRNSSVADTKLHAELWRESASLNLDLFEWVEARQSGAEALALYEKLEQLDGQANAHNLLGLAAKGEKDIAQAREYLNLALAEYEPAHHETGIANVYNNLGLIEYEEGNTELASEHWAEALRLHRQHKDERGIAEALTNLGVLAQEQGRLDEAWQYYHQALCSERELRHVVGAGRALSNMGEVAEAKEDLPCAYRLYAAAVDLFDKTGSPYRYYTCELLQRVADALQLDLNADLQRAGIHDKSLDDLIVWALGEQDESAAVLCESTATG